MTSPRAPSPIDLGRPPSWRYDLAAELARANRVPLPGVVDSFVMSAATYLRLAPRPYDPDQRRPIDEYLPVTSQAIALRLGPSRRIAHRIESLVLARVDKIAIAREVRLDVRVLRTYCALFFDIRSQLNNADYIIDHVIVPELAAGGDESAAVRCAVAKLIAWRCGRQALDALPWAGRINPADAWSPLPQLCRQAADLDDAQRLLLESLRGVPPPGRNPTAQRKWIIEVLQALADRPPVAAPTSPPGLLAPLPSARPH